jgi:hypothetical protein
MGSCETIEWDMGQGVGLLPNQKPKFGTKNSRYMTKGGNDDVDVPNEMWRNSNNWIEEVINCTAAW